MSLVLLNADPMPFGHHQGKRMEEVPLRYWRWYIDQPWAADWRAVYAYAISQLKEVMPKKEATPENGLKATPDGRIVNKDGLTVGFACRRAA